MCLFLAHVCFLIFNITIVAMRSMKLLFADLLTVNDGYLKEKRLFQICSHLRSHLLYESSVSDRNPDGTCTSWFLKKYFNLNFLILSGYFSLLNVPDGLQLHLYSRPSFIALVIYRFQLVCQSLFEAHLHCLFLFSRHAWLQGHFLPLV